MLPILRHGLLAAWMLGTGVVLLGCGSSDEDKIEDTVSSYFVALAAGDGEAACSELSGDATRELLDVALTQLPEIASVDCADVASQLSGIMGEDERNLLEEASVTGVEIDGDQATGTVEGSGWEVSLIKSGDDWLIDGGFAEGGSSAGTVASGETTETEESTADEVENTLEEAIPDLEAAGFTGVTAQRFTEGEGLPAVGSVTAEKAGASFTAAEFGTDEQARAISKDFDFLSNNGLPVVVDGDLLVYVTKCCTDSGPPPTVPSSDVEAFQKPLRAASETQ